MGFEKRPIGYSDLLIPTSFVAIHLVNPQCSWIRQDQLGVFFYRDFSMNPIALEHSGGWAHHVCQQSGILLVRLADMDRRSETLG